MLKIKSFIRAHFGSFNFIISNLLIIATILFLVITYYVIQNTLSVFSMRANARASIIEAGIYYPINSARQIMTSLAEALAQEKIEKNNQYIFRLLDNFDSKFKNDIAVPFASFKILDHNDVIIMRTAIPPHLFVPWKGLHDIALLEINKKRGSEFVVGPIRLSTLTKEEIIPFCIGIEGGDASLYKGAICSGLIVSKLNDKLNTYCSSKYLTSIRLLNKGSLEAKVAHHEVNDIFTISNMVKYYWQDKEMVVHLPLNNYPIFIEVKMNLYYITRELGQTILYSISYFIIFSMVIYCLFCVNKSFYRELIRLLQKRINDLPCNNPQITAISINQNNFNMQYLASIIESIVNHYNALYLNAQKDKDTDLPLELQNNILHLLLTEHYDNSNKENNNRLDNLYLSQLKNLINKKEVMMSLSEFLNDITEYCQDYHRTLKIRKILAKKDCKNFTFKHAALTEAIFHIFTLITRIGKFNAEGQELVIRGSFVNNNKFPTISIEVPVLDPLFKSLGWTIGHSYVYTGFISIYSLARDNNLLFRIEQINKKISFILEPLDNNRLHEIREKSLSVA